MKLEPKARPVQINKLRLGGKDINSIDDLLKNFCLSEILELGDKFTQWLDRHEAGKEYKKVVSDIFGKYTETENHAKNLLALFFPEHTGQPLRKVLDVWQKNGKNSRMLAGLLNCISPNAQLAIDLMQKNFPDKSWLIVWLKSCATKIHLSSDFCYEYGVFLKTIDAQESEVWLKKAKDMGNKKAEEELNTGKVLEIKVKGHIITMVRVNSDKGDFYIAKTPISPGLFDALACPKNYMSGHEDKAYRKRDVCELFLRHLNDATIYKWEYPKFVQWKLATEQKKTQPSPSSPMSDGEWCREIELQRGGWFEHRIAGGKKEWGDVRSYCYLRPVIEVSKNPKLQ